MFFENLCIYWQLSSRNYHVQEVLQFSNKKPGDFTIMYFMAFFGHFCTVLQHFRLFFGHISEAVSKTNVMFCRKKPHSNFKQAGNKPKSALYLRLKKRKVSKTKSFENSFDTPKGGLSCSIKLGNHFSRKQKNWKTDFFLSENVA